MVSELGFVLLALTLVLSSLSFAQLSLKGLGVEVLNFSQVKLSIAIFFFTLTSFTCLTYSFLESDFTLDVISKNSNSQLPTIYKFTGVWGNHEGSILLWLLVMTFSDFFFQIVV